MSTDYSKLSDAELSAAVAEKVAGWRMVGKKRGLPPGNSGTYPNTGIPPYATSADAVLPLLPKERHKTFWICHAGYLGYRICIHSGETGNILAEAEAPTFARAACLALLACNERPAGGGK